MSAGTYGGPKDGGSRPSLLSSNWPTTVYSPLEVRLIATRSCRGVKEGVYEGRAAESLGNETPRYPPLPTDQGTRI